MEGITGTWQAFIALFMALLPQGWKHFKDRDRFKEMKEELNKKQDKEIATITRNRFNEKHQEIKDDIKIFKDEVKRDIRGLTKGQQDIMISLSRISEHISKDD